MTATDDSGGDPAGDDGAQADRLATFEALRPRLMGVAYRLLGTVADAEDTVQDAWLRWDGADVTSVESPDAYLTTITTRLALDRLRRARTRRDAYVGTWLPEPVVAREQDPEAAAELADSLSMALLVVLETLSPPERAAFVLHEVFARPYAEVAETLGRTEPAVRQLVHRAREHVDAGHARFTADRATHAEVLQRFLAACVSPDLSDLLDVLAPDVVVLSDGGGVARAPLRPVHGQDKVARLMRGITGRALPGSVVSFEVFNGALGVVGRLDGEPVAALAIRVRDGLVQSVQLVTNPDKLRPLREGGGVAIS